MTPTSLLMLTVLTDAAAAKTSLISELTELLSRQQWESPEKPCVVRGNPNDAYHFVAKDCLTPEVYGAISAEISKEQREMIVDSFVGGKSTPLPGQKKAIFLVGGPSTGKGTIQGDVLKSAGWSEQDYVLMNTDNVMEKLEGYKAAMNLNRSENKPFVAVGDAADMLHEPAKKVSAEVMRQAIAKGLNILIDGTAKDGQKFVKSVDKLKAEGYAVEVHMPQLEPAVAMERALARAANSGRVVPPHVIQEITQKVNANIALFIKTVGAQNFHLYDTDVCRECKVERVDPSFHEALKEDPMAYIEQSAGYCKRHPDETQCQAKDSLYINI